MKIISRNINLTEEIVEASKKDYRANLVNLSQTTRDLLTRHYKKKGFM